MTEAKNTNFDFDNVYLIETTVEAVRNDTFGATDELDTALDNAQARVFGGQSEVAFVVIEIRRKKE